MNKVLLLNILLILISCSTSVLKGQNIVDNQYIEIKWTDQPGYKNPYGNQLWLFEGAQILEQHPSIGAFSYMFELPAYGHLEASFTGAEFEAFAKENETADSILRPGIRLNTQVLKDRSKYYGVVSFYPVTKTGDFYQRLLSAHLNVSFTKEIPPGAKASNRSIKTESELNTGSIYKLALVDYGVYKMDYAFFKNTLKIDVDAIDPRQIRIFTNRGGKVPELLASDRIDDLEESAVYFSNPGSSKFSASDYFLFYSQGKDDRKFDINGLHQTMNQYETKKYVFVKIDGTPGKRIQNAEEVSANNPVTSYNAFYHYEEDKVNLLSLSTKEGGGQEWYGDIFETTREKQYNIGFEDLDDTKQATVEVKFAARSDQPSPLNVNMNGAYIGRITLPRTSISNSDADYAISSTANIKATHSGTISSITLNFPNNGGAESKGWLDYIEINAVRKAIYKGGQMAMFDTSSASKDVAGFKVATSLSQPTVWEVSDPTNVGNIIPVADGSGFSFGYKPQSKVKQFVVFNPGEVNLVPEYIGPIANQNLHGITKTHMVIIYPPEFKDEVTRLATHRRNYSNIDIVLVNANEVYNEFGCGSKDPGAIRDFLKMIYLRDPDFKYALLAGTGSYDYRGLKTNLKYSNIVPTYIAQSGINSIYAYPSDDFFTLLETSPKQGTNPLFDAITNISVGRLAVHDNTELKNVIDKIINYDTSAVFMDDWRTRLTFLSDDDDDDGGGFSNSTDANARFFENNYPRYNVNKIYLDAFKQESTPGGERSYEMENAINNEAFRGHLVLAYLGHGGPRGITQERVMEKSDIISWQNGDKLPFIVMATCSFMAFDDPAVESAGEVAHKKQNGGCVGLFSTVRSVTVGTTFSLAEYAFKYLLTPQNGEYLTLGDALKAAKIAVSPGGAADSRKIMLFGDPSQHLAIPHYNAIVTKINNKTIDSSSEDTLRALGKIVIEGEIRDNDNHVLSDFSGKINTTIYDKFTDFKTLGSQFNSVLTYKVRKNILFKGASTVTNGKFTVECYLPKDILYNYGYGKISLYADDGKSRDAWGEYSKITIGGTDTTVDISKNPPIVEVFMNDDKFKTGGITNENPILLVKLRDNYGINVSGLSIGHDLEGALNGPQESSFVLNQFYKSDVDSFRKGEARYPLNNLPEGTYRVKVKAWNILNISGEGSTEFIVAKSSQTVIKKLLNYPNPFSTRTYFQFEHNLTGRSLQAQIDIYSISGQLVKTITQSLEPTGSLVDDISWNGADNSGSPLANGIYIFRLRLTSTDQASPVNYVSEGEKLVLIN